MTIADDLGCKATKQTNIKIVVVWGPKSIEQANKQLHQIDNEDDLSK